MNTNVLALLGASLMLAACNGGTSSSSSTPRFPSGSNSTGRAAAALQVKGTAPSGTVDWDSFGYDLQRTGYNPSETAISTSNVRTLQKAWSFAVGGKMMREPVLASGVMIGGQPTNVVYGGSSKGSALYAINADTGAVLWKDPVPSISFPCGTTAQFSVQATPAIDRAANRIYFTDGHDAVHAVDLSTGAEAAGWPITAAPYAGGHNNMHGGLTFNPANSMLYAVSSSICDYQPWYGRLVAINTRSATMVGKFFPVSGTSKQGGMGGGIWGAGGASVDPITNHVFVATGNADIRAGQAQNAGNAENVVMLSSDVNTVLAANYPANLETVSGYNDLDFGSTPMLFQPPGCPLMAAALNKAGMFELYDTATIASGPVQFIEMSIAQDNGDFQGVPAYDPVTNDVYVALPATYGIYQPGLAAFRVQANCTLDPTPVWNAVFGPDGAASSAKTVRGPVTIANGVVYNADGIGKTEFAFDAATGTKLWHVTLSSEARGGTIVANGRVYVSATGDGTITAFALPGATAGALNIHR